MPKMKRIFCNSYWIQTSFIINSKIYYVIMSLTDKQFPSQESRKSQSNTYKWKRRNLFYSSVSWRPWLRTILPCQINISHSWKYFPTSCNLDLEPGLASTILQPTWTVVGYLSPGSSKREQKPGGGIRIAD